MHRHPPPPDLGAGHGTEIPHDPTAAAPQFPYYGLEHIGLTVDDVDAACDELLAKGADVVIGPLTRDPGTRLAFIRGPEGIMVELVQIR